MGKYVFFFFFFYPKETTPPAKKKKKCHYHRRRSSGFPISLILSILSFPFIFYFLNYQSKENQGSQDLAGVWTAVAVIAQEDDDGGARGFKIGPVVPSQVWQPCTSTMQETTLGFLVAFGSAICFEMDGALSLGLKQGTWTLSRCQVC